MAGNHFALYGRADGGWAILRTPDDGTVIPPVIGELRYLGDAAGAIPAVYSLARGAAKLPAQEMIAALTGLGQQAVSRHVRIGTSVPDMTDDGWKALTRLLHAWTEWPDKPCDAAVVEEFLATAARERARYRTEHEEAAPCVTASGG
jgi:hypothetical protein